MERFNEILGTEMDKIFFGHKQFLIAYEKKAIDTLIFTDGYLRKLSGQERKDLSQKIKDLKNKAEVCQFSSLHTTGEKVDEFGGIVGILKYVMPELSEMEEDEEEEKKGNTNIDDEIKDENLMDLINNNLVNYNQEDEDEKEEKKGKKKSKEENKNISQQKRKYQRKRSSFDNDEDNDEY